ncbi:hypothetical protein VTK73DRAFT_2487 [Phialemonium thermophilum]|uniref:Protein kinase domain-containing protein n=1 Tax=Phialemonium thermophilum TaxID=223376 RepID=A0ABR3Y205_9PEZI
MNLLEATKKSGGRGGYTAGVGIWSLGVVIFRSLAGLPRQARVLQCGVEWCQTMVDKLQDDFIKVSDDLKLLLLSMVVIEPGRRSSAFECYARARLLPFRHHELNEAKVRHQPEMTFTGDGAIGSECCESPTWPAGAGRLLGPSFRNRSNNVVIRHPVLTKSSPHKTRRFGDSGRYPALWISVDADAFPKEVKSFVRKRNREVLPPPASVKFERQTGPLSLYQPVNGLQEGSFSEVTNYSRSLRDPFHPLGGGSDLAAELNDMVAPNKVATTRKTAIGDDMGRDIASGQGDGQQNLEASERVLLSNVLGLYTQASKGNKERQTWTPSEQWSDRLGDKETAALLLALRRG